MANETTVQPSCIQDISEVDENLAPEVSTSAETSYLDGHSSVLRSGENTPLSETCTFSTPAHGSGKKSRISGLQSALTPILKYLNIANRRPSSELLKSENNPRLSLSTVNTVNCQKSNGGFSKNPTSSKDTPVCWLNGESLPELTFYDDTCDTTMEMTRNASNLPDAVLASPVSTLRSTTDANNPLTKVSSNTAEREAIDQASSVSKNDTQTSCHMNQRSTDTDTDKCSLQRSTAVSQEVSVIASSLPNGSFEGKANGTITWSESESPQTTMNTITPPHGSIASTKESNSDLPPKRSKHNGTVVIDDSYSKEMTLLGMTFLDLEQTPGAEMSFLEVGKEFPQESVVKHSQPLSELSEAIVAEPGRVDKSQGGGLSTTITDGVSQITGLLREQSKGLEESMKSLEATRDISMCSVGGNDTSKLSEVNLVNDQPLAEDTLHPANVTRDMSASSDMSVQCTASQQSSTSDEQCNTSLKHATSELQAEPVDSSSSVEATKEVLLTSRTSNAEAPQPGASMSDMFTVAQLSKLSTTTELNTTNQMSCPQNNTVDFPPSIVGGPKAECEATCQASAELKETPEMPLALSRSTEVQNATFDRHSLQKPNGISISEEAGSATFCLQNNTFDPKPPCKQNGTITLSETSASESHQNPVDIPAPLKVCHSTIVHDDNPTEASPPEASQQNLSNITGANTKTVHSPEGTFNAYPPVAAAPETGSQSVTALSDTMDHQSIDAENSKANTFNLDDTFDMKSDPLVTSTPMTHCKFFDFKTENMESKFIRAQKKLYRDGVGQSVAPVPSEVPANIVSDRKTLLTQPDAKSLLPPLKAASQLLKYKPAATLPGRCEPFTSSLPMTRQRIHVEAFKNPAASEAAKGTTGISNCYNLRSTTTGSKQPNSALPRPQLSGIPSATQRPAAGLRPPSARSIAPPSSSTDKIRGPTAANPVAKTTQIKKHLLTRSEPLPSAKRKKLDAPVPSSGAGAATSACDVVNRAKNLKQPVTAQRTVPPKAKSDGAAVPVSAVETSKSCNTSGSAGALKVSAHSYRAHLAKPQGHGCAKCAVLEEQLKMKLEEIQRLKQELLKYSKQEESRMLQ